jgi:arylsulfatase A-like enzyme
MENITKTWVKSSLTVVSSAVMMSCQEKDQQQPNVVLFFADDLGWMDLGCYGSSFYDTPHLDQLAKEGMLFTDAYAACPVSSPTRVSLQTGRYPVRTGITDWIKGRYHTEGRREQIQNLAPVLPPENIFNMPLEEVTIAEVLKEHGYQTAFLGKWHVAEDSLYFPQYQGYDINIGGGGMGAPGPNGYFTPYKIPYITDGPEGEYLTDRLGDECVKIIRQFKDKPFFINFSFYQVHTPLIGKPDKVRYYQEKARKMGLDTVRTHDENPPWKAKQPFQVNSYRERLVQSHAVYAAMVSSMDDNVGKVVAELKRLGLYENTIIIFTADNGGLSTAEGSPTCNYPLRAGKGHIYEGGIREPFIVTWKGQIAENSISNTQVTTIDVFPTILDLVNVPIPRKLKIDGVSIKPALQGESQKRGAIYWHYPHYSNQGARPAGAVREGDYKLIEFYDTGEMELYNLRDDIGESKNLVHSETKIAKKLSVKFDKWRKETGAKMPTKNPDYQGN